MLIGVSGKIGHGKDEIAKRLADRYGFVRMGWATELKEELIRNLSRTLCEILRLHGYADPTPEQIREAVYVQKPAGVRELLQEYGTQVRRGDDDRYWIDKLLGQWDRMGNPNAVVPDTRFKNEAASICMLRDASASLIAPLVRYHARLVKVVRPGFPSGTHESEVDLDDWTDWDHVFVNDGSVEDLYRQVDAWMEGVRVG